MLKYFVKKFLAIIPMLFIISLIVFLALQIVPVDPINYMVSPDMAANTANIEALRQQLGLNDPVIIRYFRWLIDLLHGDFGYSIVNGVPIAKLIAMKLPATIELSMVALVISAVLGIGIGLLSAIRQNGIIDYVGRIIAVIGTSIPHFFFGILVIQLFAIKLGWFPAAGRLQYGDDSFFMKLNSLILPAITMGISMISALLRYTRNSMLDVMNKEYVKTARSKGIPEWKVYLKHAFRNALGPILVILMFRLPILIGGSVIIETIFSWSGIGTTILNGVTAGDYPVIMITTLMIAAAVLFASFLVDLVNALLDPRIRIDQ